MKSRDCRYDYVTIALAAGIMLAVPFSCLLVPALLDLFDRGTEVTPVGPTKNRLRPA